MLKRSFLLALLLSFSGVCALAAPTPPELERISKCLPEEESVTYSLASHIKDQPAEQDPNPDRPIAYVQYLATHEKGGQWLGLVMIMKANTCVNPVPAGEAIDYERHAPFEIAVMLQMKELQLQDAQEQIILEQVKQGKGPPGDLYGDLGDGEESLVTTSACGVLTAVDAEARKQMDWTIDGCKIQEKRPATWVK